ncbi:histidine--tRNA ligase [Capnocytophaga catalasegens]|uniref:Histidine--tRNA ligase n=1 Tax=Capnocytophaga catalasegens TaxID=1004260 RepID=A0AAV5ARM4_9FLAO|nr:histidine--tRNA ligase [Capnocytophaga catalasegens]GIZ15915.1 histidine--tRNA ligase [Capnocytophaga catalasegens]GJM49979.1 histidine--tRNA ligase [Capnocytophaga catalasegens]GJM54129.1 histidine--tRNA ligase [Capnocytophaga catalasegens]
MIYKPSIPKGTRDFSPTELKKRIYIQNKIKEKFELFGFQPIETPSFENYETLMGKYGEEGDRLIFKILNSGDFLTNVSDEFLNEKNSQRLTPQISEKALRYDLTVPFARYVVQHQNELTLPFKRYQIQPVWRADRPQKGRYREFFQCDADVVGSQSLWQEIELIQLYDSVFNSLNMKGVTIKINHRKILSGFAQIIGQSDKLIDFTTALDKLDKIGKEKVIQEMLSRGISSVDVQTINPIFELNGTFLEKINQLREILVDSQVGLQGITELEFICNAIAQLPLSVASLELDVTLARGLNYYTGAIFEVVAPQQIQLGSIGGGGRYDDLTGIFGLKNMSGVGISFGLDRIYLVLEQLGLFPEEINQALDILFINFGHEEAIESLRIINQLRQKGYKTELYPETSKLKKQLAYADKRGANYVIIIGENELKKQQFILKNMVSGQQTEYNFSDINQFKF